MKKGKKLYEGKAKILYAAPEKGTAIQHFKDHTTAFNNQKKLGVNLTVPVLTGTNSFGVGSKFLPKISKTRR